MDLIYRALLFVKYCLQSIIRLFVYVVLMNIFVDKMVVASLKLLPVWSLSFIAYLNLVHNLSIISIWFLTFLVPCKFSHCRYLFDGKNDMLNEIIKNYFPCHINYQLYRHIRLFYNNKKIQIKICT